MSADAPLVTVDLVVNGDRHRKAVPARTTLLELLRYELGLTGTKQGCDQGECGACTVLLDGAPVLSCLTLAVEADGARVETIEGVARGPTLDPLQIAFVRHGAPQCGFCTPGLLLSAHALLRKPARPTEDEIRMAISGNLCRCTDYRKFVEAIDDAAQELERARAAGEGE